MDKDNSQLYQDNADAYINKLAGLDSDYENVCENSRLKTVIFGDRFPFRYLVDDYGIDYYAAFAGVQQKQRQVLRQLHSFLAR